MQPTRELVNRELTLARQKYNYRLRCVEICKQLEAQRNAERDLLSAQNGANVPKHRIKRVKPTDQEELAKLEQEVKRLTLMRDSLPKPPRPAKKKAESVADSPKPEQQPPPEPPVVSKPARKSRAKAPASQ